MIPPIKTLIIDDEPIALDKLRNYAVNTPALELVAECRGGFEAIDYLRHNEADLIFTDVNMPDLNGLEFVESLENPPMIVFTTAHPQYAAEAFKLWAVDYLLKPYRYADFQRAVNRAIEVYRTRHPQADTEPSAEAEAIEPVSAMPADADAPDASLFVKVESRWVRVAQADITYIKGYGEYLQIFVDGNARPLMTISSFAAIRSRLGSAFMQVHRSYIVNMNRVRHIERSRIVMDADTYIPVSDSYKVEFQNYLLSHAVGKK